MAEILVKVTSWLSLLPRISVGNILEIVDETIPDYDFEELWKANQENLIGKYIEAFGGCETGSVEYEALCEGIQALMANRQ